MVYDASSFLQVDPLKFHTYGIKKPIEQKQESIQNLYDQQKRYYPIDKHGQIDEWGAVIRKQAENYEREQNEAKIRKNFLQKQYGHELMLAAQKKEEDAKLEKLQKRDDYERMQKNIQLKATLEQLEKSHA